MAKRGITYKPEEHAIMVRTGKFLLDIKDYTIFSLCGDVKEKRILDAGCGDGSLCRRAIDKGAEYVLGIDGSEGMIRLAEEANKGYEDSIEYKINFIEDFNNGKNDFDIVIGSFLLNYAQNQKILFEYCNAINSHLKKGGSFIGLNDNPFDIFNGIHHYSKYGFKKIMQGNKEGGKVIYDCRPAVKDDIINYHLNPKAYGESFLKNGFNTFEWKDILLNPKANQEYWKELFDRKPSPYIAIIAKK